GPTRVPPTAAAAGVVHAGRRWRVRPRPWGPLSARRRLVARGVCRTQLRGRGGGGRPVVAAALGRVRQLGRPLYIVRRLLRAALPGVVLRQRLRYRGRDAGGLSVSRGGRAGTLAVGVVGRCRSVGSWPLDEKARRTSRCSRPATRVAPVRVLTS